MRIIRRLAGLIERVAVGALVGTVTLVSRLLDGSVGLVGRMSDRLDLKLAALAREAQARHARRGQRQINPITLD